MKTVVFATNARFETASDGNVYGVNTSITRNTFDHYLKSFDHVKVLARVGKNPSLDTANKVPVNDEKVSFLKLPYFIGPRQYLKVRSQVNVQIASHLQHEQTLIARVPGLVGRLAASFFKKMNRPYGVEVAGDPWDLFSPVASEHPLKWFLRFQGYYALKKTVYNSSAALYVTKDYLQQRYPTQDGVFSTHASNVIIKESDIKSEPKVWQSKPVYDILTVGTLDQLYKSPDLMIDLIRRLNTSNSNIKVRLKWIGGGKHLERLRQKVKDLQVDKDIEFVGKIRDRAVMNKSYADSDAFLLLSKTEGLPRAVIEAMSFGLPVVATNAGGIKELLDESVVFDHSELGRLENRLVDILNDADVYNEQASKNLQKSKDYTQNVLNSRRWNFYNKLIEMSPSMDEKISVH